LLLTATLTKEILLSVCKKLHIDHPAIVAKSPDRYLQHHTNHSLHDNANKANKGNAKRGVYPRLNI